MNENFVNACMAMIIIIMGLLFLLLVGGLGGLLIALVFSISIKTAILIWFAVTSPLSVLTMIIIICLEK